MPTNTADVTAKSDSNINAAITIIDAAKSAIEATASDTRYNVFETLNMKETQHSLIIHGLLCYNKNYFLPKFIDHINTLKNKNGNSLKLRPADFTDARVEREKKYENSNGDMKIDLLITDRKSGKTIIIENKLNRAKDQPRQIPRYYDAVVDDGYKVVGVIYIPRNERKNPDRTTWTQKDKNDVDPKLRIFPGYDEQGPDLVKWLADCEASYSNADLSHADNQNVVAILTQYREHLRYKEDMYMDAMNDFYEHLWDNKEVSVQDMTDAHNMLGDLGKYVAQSIFEKWKPQFCEIGLAADSKFETVIDNGRWWAFFPGLQVGVNQEDGTSTILKFKIGVWVNIPILNSQVNYRYQVRIEVPGASEKLFKQFTEKIRNEKYESRCRFPKCFEQLIIGGDSLEADEKELSDYLTNLLDKLKPLKP